MPQGPGTKQIAQYRIVRELGRGGQGSVYLADDVRLGRKVALKVLTGLSGLSPKSVKRFRREAEITARLDHPGICTTYDFGEEDGMPWIAMRYVEGLTLSARIADARSPHSPSTSEHLSFADGEAPERKATPPLPPPSASRSREDIAWVVGIVEQTARALHVAHESGVVHRDIKPANIMVATDGCPVILDFGLANVIEADGAVLTRTGELMGTPQYIAPEQLARHGFQIDRRADVYSLGVTLYEALTLSRPFDAPTRERLYQAIIAKDAIDPHKLNPTISRDLSAVVATAIEKDRDRRYQTALAFADDLRRVLHHQPVVARRAGPAMRTLRWAERNPAVASSLAALFMVLVAALVSTLFLLGKRDEALTVKDRTLADLVRELDTRRMRELTSTADALFPFIPAKVPDMKSWLAKADDVAGRLAVHERALTELASAPKPEDQEKRQTLTELVRDLRRFLDPDPNAGIVAEVRRRLGIAETIRRRSIDDFADRWSYAIASIRDPAKAPKYGGLKLVPQVGLVPIGQNSKGLWEFAVLDSGALPETDGRDASFHLEEEGAIVLVLVPPGAFDMGSPANELGRADDEARQKVTMPAFFIGKFEVTQAQWVRVMRSNPSGNTTEKDPDSTPIHPVEWMPWGDAAEFAQRLALLLPSEAEWEYACRAGSEAAYAWGPDASCLKGRANVSDQSLAEKAPATYVELAQWNDGFAYTAPVNALEANEFALFGLHGNVSEWCRDWYRPKPETDGVPPDGGPPPSEFAVKTARKAARDGCYGMPPSAARSAVRRKWSPFTVSPTIGLRVARAIDLTPP